MKRSRETKIERSAKIRRHAELIVDNQFHWQGQDWTSYEHEVDLVYYALKRARHLKQLSESEKEEYFMWSQQAANAHTYWDNAPTEEISLYIRRPIKSFIDFKKNNKRF